MGMRTAAACMAGVLTAAAPAAAAPGQWDVPALVAGLRGPASEIVEPFKLVGDIYYVGAQNIASYLIATPEGLILIDTGTARMGPGILANIRKLGFDPRDVWFLLASHAHFDHVEGHALMVRATGAKVVALGPDAAALERGKDLSAVGLDGWEPVRVDRVIKDGDTVVLGGTTLQAIALPGHTQGATGWLTQVRDGGRSYSVLILGGVTPNDWADMIDNRLHPHVVEDTLRTLERLNAMSKPDIVLPGHPQALFAGKIDRIKASERPHPLLISDDGWTALISGGAFFDNLKRQATADTH